LAARRIAAVAAAAACALPAVADGAVLHPCGRHLECGRVAVPLDPSGRVPGRVDLAVRRYTPSGDASHGTVIALAGGPGQSSIDFLYDFADDLHPALGHRALVVFDARGVGRSDPLRCRVPASSAHLISSCARSLGPRRALYSTMHSVDDIDSVRQALGLERVSLEGVSYGTYLALSYARAHPDNVERLVLDSTLAAESPFDLDSIVAMRRVLAGMCASACPGVAPLQDLVALLGRLPTHGPRYALTSSQAGLLAYEALFASDLHPFVRASLPAALHLAARGELTALTRLAIVAEGSRHRRRARAAGGMIALAIEPRATRCEDTPFPWAQGDAVDVRKAKLRAGVAALPADAIAPFDHETILDEASIGSCVEWPEAGDAPERATAPLPDVPALVISGTDDIRTPLEVAQQVASQLPHSTLLSVPGIGHSVLGDSGCAARAVRSLFAGTAIAPCASRPAAPVDPLPPRLSELAPSGGAAGQPGRVLRAAVLTLRHDIGLVGDALGGLGVMGGTRGGYVLLSGPRNHSRYTIHSLSYVKGIQINGHLTAARHSGVAVGRVIVRLHGRRYGHLDLRSDLSIRGRLGGHRVHLTRAARERINTAGGLTDIPRG
jgi:pimeloyl-ACP methyl ester carboxylesterase